MKVLRHWAPGDKSNKRWSEENSGQIGYYFGVWHTGEEDINGFLAPRDTLESLVSEAKLKGFSLEGAGLLGFNYSKGDYLIESYLFEGTVLAYAKKVNFNESNGSNHIMSIVSDSCTRLNYFINEYSLPT